jgi:hypothetical protein
LGLVQAWPLRRRFGSLGAGGSLYGGIMRGPLAVHILEFFQSFDCPGDGAPEFRSIRITARLLAYIPFGHVTLSSNVL